MVKESGRARAWVLIFVLAAVGGLGTLIGVGCAIRANACPFGSAPRQTSTDGRVLFDANCVLCHGRHGAGGTGPSLVSGAATSLTREELGSRIGRGRPLAGMPAFRRTLTQEQIDAVAEFVDALRGGAPTPGGIPT